MYEAIGEVTAATVSELKDFLSDAKWEEHISDATHHHAANGTELVKSVDGITSIWPVTSWKALTFFRLVPGGKLYRHHDSGYGFHIPVETNNDCISMTYGNDVRKEQHLEVGTIYRIDRSLDHESFNNGETNRTHLIVMLKESEDGK